LFFFLLLAGAGAPSFFESLGPRVVASSTGPAAWRQEAAAAKLARKNAGAAGTCRDWIRKSLTFLVFPAARWPRANRQA